MQTSLVMEMYNHFLPFEVAGLRVCRFDHLSVVGVCVRVCARVCVCAPPPAFTSPIFLLCSCPLQASILLRCPKYSLEDFKLISSISLLNSRQVTLLLDNYQLEEGEPPLCPNFATRLVTCAKIQCDKVCVCVYVRAGIHACVRMCSVCVYACVHVCFFVCANLY